MNAKPLTRQEIRQIINRLEERAERYELEHVAKAKAFDLSRRQEAEVARRRAKTTRAHIQELASLINP